MLLFLVTAAFILVLPQFTVSVSEVYCGPNYNNTKCANSTWPCCSPIGECGTGPAQCSGGCMPSYSFSTSKTKGSCYVSREKMGMKCVSGNYDFSSKTWVQNLDAYNGDINSADFVVDNPKNTVKSGNNLVLKLTPSVPFNQFNPGKGVLVSSTSYLSSGGRISAKFSTSIPSGVILTFGIIADDKQEIKFDISGKNGKAYPHMFTTAKKYGEQAFDIPGDAEFSIDWNQDRIQWLINSDVVKEVKGDVEGYFTTPGRPNFIIFDGGALDDSRSFAGDYIQWDENKNIQVTLSKFMVACDASKLPTTQPTRKQGYKEPGLNNSAIIVTVPGLGGYWENKFGFPSTYQESKEYDANSAAGRLNMWTFVFGLILVIGIMQ